MADLTCYIATDPSDQWPITLGVYKTFEAAEARVREHVAAAGAPEEDPMISKWSGSDLVQRWTRSVRTLPDGTHVFEGEWVPAFVGNLDSPTILGKSEYEPIQSSSITEGRAYGRSELSRIVGASAGWQMGPLGHVYDSETNFLAESIEDVAWAMEQLGWFRPGDGPVGYAAVTWPNVPDTPGEVTRLVREALPEGGKRPAGA